MRPLGDFVLKRDKDITDRVGVRTLILSQMWAVERGELSIEELDALKPARPAVPPGLLFIGEQTQQQPGVFRTLWTFEGVDERYLLGRGNSYDFGFTPGFSEATILRHPKIGDLLDKYEGTVLDAQVIWPRLLSGANTGAGLGQSNQATDKPNPMFGRDTYFTFQGGTYWYRYIARDESEIPDIIGNVFEAGQLPGVAKRASGRNYLCAGSPYVRRGLVLDVTEQYWLSDEGGWPAGGAQAPIYKRKTIAA